MADQDLSVKLLSAVDAAVANKTPLNIVGSGTKSFLGRASDAIALNVDQHRGVISYEPTELVIKARSGTRIAELEKLLAAEGQMMPFEPPMFAQDDTLGGVIACGLSGPGRPYAGSARDFVLGMGVINGRAEQLSFGGEVMKNVAGYDVSRLQVGAMGTLGVILDVSMKVLPSPKHEVTVQIDLRRDNDLASLIKLARQPLPVSAAAVEGRQCRIRLSGSEPSVTAAVSQIGGEIVEDGKAYWDSLRCHKHAFFDVANLKVTGAVGSGLWRISMADHAPLPKLEGQWLLEWGGAQRWLRTDMPSADVFAACSAVGGHATRYAGFEPGAVAFQPLSGPLQKLQQNVRLAFDPDGLFNRGRFHNDN